MRRSGTIASIVTIVGLAFGCGGSEDVAAPSESWRDQIGTEAADTSFGAALAPDGDVVLVASTEGSLAGANQGGRDVYVARTSPDGEEIWSVQLGGPQNDAPLGVSVAGDGSIYAAGFTEGDFAGPHQGSADVWVARFDADGEELWKAQFGGPEWDRGFDVAAVDDGVYVTGYTASVMDPGTDRAGFDGFVARFDADGEMMWVRQFGTDATEWGQGAAAFEDGVYVTGYTEGVFEGQQAFGDKDAFVLAMSSEGDLNWVSQFGSDKLDWTQGVGIGADDGVLVAGSTEGSVASDGVGGRDLLIAAFDADGNQQFATQLGTSLNDSVFEVRLVGDRIVASGTTEGDLAGSAGGRDALLVWLDLEGQLLEIEQFGSAAADEATGLDARSGTVIYSGYTAGDIAGPNQGGNDIITGAEVNEP